MGEEQAARRSRGRQRGVIGSLVAVLLVAMAVGVVNEVRNFRQFDGAAAPRLSDVLDLNVDQRFLPFDPANRLAVADPPASLRVRRTPKEGQEPYPILGGDAAVFPLCATLAQAVYDVRLNATDEARGYSDEYVRCGTPAARVKGFDRDGTDLAFVLDPGKADVAGAKQQLGNLRQELIALEAFVFFVHKDNPVTSLTRQQLRDIYSGRVTNWKQVGGRDESIQAFQRPSEDRWLESGSQAAMIARTMAGEKLAGPPTERIPRGLGSIQVVAEYRNLPNAIGYSFRWHATVLNADPDVRLLAVDGVEPTNENLRNGTYPLPVEVRAFTAESKNPDTERFLRWITGPEGRALIEKAGYAAPGR